LFSLQEVNRKTDEAPHAWEDEASAEWPMLRVLAAARRLGQDHIDDLYRVMGEARHERGEELPGTPQLRSFAAEVGLAEGFVDAALEDPTTGKEVRAEHEDIVGRVSAFGVPTLVLDGGAGRGIFGPVLTPVPTGEDAGEVFDHVAALLRRPDFYELKRTRDRRPDIGRYREEPSIDKP
jgi:protein-disulfide isomerase-like protein with CxxC motif